MTRPRPPQPLPDARGRATSRSTHERRSATPPRDVSHGEEWARYQPIGRETHRATQPSRTEETSQSNPDDGRGEARALLELRRALLRARRERRDTRRALVWARGEVAARAGVAQARIALAEAERALEAARAEEARAAGREVLVAWLRAREITELTSADARGVGPEVREHVLNAMRADDARREVIQTAWRAGGAALGALICVALGMGAHWLWLVALFAVLAAGYLAWRGEAQWRRLQRLRESVAASERRMIEREALGRVCRQLGSAPEEVTRLEERLRAAGVAVPASVSEGWAALVRWPAAEESREAMTTAHLAAVGMVERRRALLEVALAGLAEARRAREEVALEASVPELERRLAEREARLGELAERARTLGIAARPGALAAAYGAARARHSSREN